MFSKPKDRRKHHRRHHTNTNTGRDTDKAENEKSNNNSNIISTHKVIGYSYIIIDRVLGPVFERYYVGDNAGDLLLKNLERDWMYLREHIIKISKKRSYSFAFNPLTSKNPENIEVAMVYQSSTPQFYKTT